MPSVTDRNCLANGHAAAGPTRRTRTDKSHAASPPADAAESYPTAEALAHAARRLEALEVELQEAAEAHRSKKREVEAAAKAHLSRIHRTLAAPGPALPVPVPQPRVVDLARRMAAIELAAACEAYEEADARVGLLGRLVAGSPAGADGEAGGTRDRALPWSVVAEEARRSARRRLVDVALKAAHAFDVTDVELADLDGEPLGLTTKDWVVILRPHVTPEGRVCSGRDDVDVTLIDRQDMNALD